MHLPRAIYSGPKEFSKDETIVLLDQEFHHIVNVKRLAAKDQLEVYHLQSRNFALAEVTSIAKDSVTLRIQKTAKKKSPRSTTIICGLPELSTAEGIIEKCGELGVSKLVFFNANRSQGYLIKKIDTRRLNRWQKISFSAFKQSLQANPLQIGLETSLEAALSSMEKLDIKYSSRIFLHPDLSEKPSSVSLTDLLKLPKQKHSKQVLPNNFSNIPDSENPLKKPLEITEQDAEVYIVIGPEGGLSETEVSLLNNSGFHHGTLGLGILRVETAAVLASGLAIL